MKSIILFLIASIQLISTHAQTGEPPFIKSIFFGGGSYYIDSRQTQELNEWLDGFPGLEGYNIIINSHTDNIGSIEYNKRLSEWRTESVLRILENRGLARETISRESFGEENPVYDNATWEGKLHNRRADVILIPPNT